MARGQKRRAKKIQRSLGGIMVLMKQTKQQPQKEKERGREKERQEVL